MKPVLFAIVSGWVLAATAAVAGPGLFIAGPKGCDLLEGWVPSDAGAGAFLEPEHWFLDYEVLEGWDTYCWFDEMLALDPKPGMTETRGGMCETDDGSQTKGTFTVEYFDDGARLSFSEWDAPLDFVLCTVD
jgi:hypothetical protein